MYLKDTSGKKSLTATMAVISFVIVMFKVLLNGSSITIGTNTYAFGSIDGFTIGSIFTPILGSYMARRWNNGSDEGVGENVQVADVQDAGGRPGDGAL